MLVKGAVIYPLGINLDFWEETVYYRPRWQTRDSYKAFLLITFIGGHGGKSNNSMILVKFSRLRHDFNLLEGNADVMDSHPIHELEMLGA